MYCVTSKSVWFANVFKSNFIHSQNFSAVEIVSEEVSCKENMSIGIFFCCYCEINLMVTNCKSENHL